MYVIDAYTALELSENIEDDFDMLSEFDLLPIVVGAIGKEYDDINILLQIKCDDILMDNAIEAQFGKACEGVLDMLETMKNTVNALTDKVQIEDLVKMFGMLKG